jgi:signal transduction histidine kinase
MKLRAFAWWRLGDSLRLRLLAGTLAWVVAAVLLAGWGLRGLFRDHIAQQLQAQLVLQLDQLSAAVNSLPGGRIEAHLAGGDPRLEQPLSGLYWQVDQLDGSDRRTSPGLLRSRSLWDQTLDWQLFQADTGHAHADPEGTAPLAGTLPDGQGHLLVAVSRPLQLPEAEAPPLRLIVAADSALLAEPMQRFTYMLVAALGALAAGLALAVVLQLRLALRPLKLLRTGLSDVRTGATPRLEGRFPQELQPLVQEFNHVLEVNADMVQRARTQAGNLAHAVNTPLTILGNAAAQEGGPLAELVREQVASASRQVDHHLARARAAARQATGLRTPLQPPLAALVRTMERLHAGRGIAFTLVGDAARWDFLGDAQDLMEMLGNLLDNAGKWARHAVRLQVQEHEGRLLLTVDDDGPGIDPALQQRIFERGERLDERQPGAGLGLDIVRELVQTYGGHIEAASSPLGGLRMRLLLPAQRSAA